jgi:lipoprotein NlpI
VGGVNLPRMIAPTPTKISRAAAVRALAVALALVVGGCRTPPAPTAEQLALDGVARAERKDFAGAAADFRRALALRPDDADTRYNLGLALLEGGDLAGAEAELRRALALRPGDAEAWHGLGQAAFNRRDYAAAIAAFDRALALDAGLVDTVYARALARRRSGDFDGAFADYDRAVALAPDYWRAYNGRATTRNAHGDFALAIPDYERRIALEPTGSEYAWFQRSLLLRRLGRDPELAALSAEVARWPDDWPKVVGQFLLGHLGADELLRRAAAPADAQARREQLCEANYYVGITALLAGRTDEAREKFSACVATGVEVFLEHLLARSELARLGAANR